MLYICSAMVVRAGKWKESGQVPTFILDSRIQGIVDAAHAEIIATEIINPFRIKGITVYVRPQAADEQVYLSSNSSCTK